MTRQRGYSDAASYKLTVHAEETQSVDVLKIGQVTIGADCTGDEDPDNAGQLATGFGFWVQNDSSGPVLVATPGDPAPGYLGPQMVLQPGEGDPVFGVGQGAIIDNDYNSGQVVPFTVMQQNGPSVSGTVSMWLRAGGPLDGTATCLFSAQARG